MALTMIAAACGRSGSDMTDGPDPFAAPTPFEVADTVIATPSPEEILFAPVVSELGYALVPRQLPDGFELGTGETLMFPSNPTGRQIYSESTDSKFELHISYPMIFPPTGGSLFEHAGFGIPEDALIEIPLSGSNGADGAGFLIRGGWDPQTLRLELPTEARWDYERSLTVMIAFQMGSVEPVWVAVRAEHLPEQWISVAELISIAESIDKVP